MKAIALWQPHASLAIAGIKPYETRSWRLPPSMIGQRVWIHAAKSQEDLVDLGQYMDDCGNGDDRIPSYDAIIGALLGMGVTTLNDLPRGCLLGTVVLEASTPTTELISPGYFGDFSPGRYAWSLVDPQPLATPIPYKGMQGFFEVRLPC